MGEVAFRISSVGGFVTFTTDEMEFMQRKVTQIWNQMADDMFYDDMGKFDPSITFSAMDVYDFAAERTYTLDKNDQVLLDSLMERVRKLGRGNTGYSDFIKTLLGYKEYGY